MNKVVSIDIDSHFIKAVVVRRKKNKAVVSSCARVARTQDDISVDFANLCKKKDFCSGAGIVITDRAQFLASELSGIPEGGEVSEDKLLSAAAWEMEPYLDFPVPEGLFACQIQDYKTKADTTSVLISAVNRSTCSEFSRTLKRYGLTLYRAYSPEGALISVSSFPAEGKNKMVIDCRQDTVKGILLLSTGPSVFQSRSLKSTGLEQAVEDVIQSLGAGSAGPGEIVIAGDGAVDDLIAALKPKFENIKRWGAADGLVEIEVASGIGFGSEFATAVGAAVQELGLAGQPPFGITDRVSVIKAVLKKAKEDKRFFSAIVFIPLFLSIAAHCTVTKLSISRHSAAVKLLKEKKKRLLEPLNKKAAMETKLVECEQKRAYLERVLPARRKNLLRAFFAISHLRPPDIVLTGFSREKEGIFVIEGDALCGRSVACFKNNLSGLEFCEEATIETLSNKEDKGRKFFPSHFIINLRFTRE